MWLFIFTNKWADSYVMEYMADGFGVLVGHWFV